MTGVQWSGSVDLGRGPAHNPKAVDKCLGGEGAELCKKFVRDMSAGSWALGEGAVNGGGVGAEECSAEG